MNLASMEQMYSSIWTIFSLQQDLLELTIEKRGLEQEQEQEDRPEEDNHLRLIITILPQLCSSSEWGGV